MSKPRYVVECIWSGYTSYQRKVCHRSVVRYDAEALSRIKSVRFMDNTDMSVSVRRCSPRERVEEIHGYDELLTTAIDAKMEGHITVLDLPDKSSTRRLR